MYCPQYVVLESSGLLSPDANANQSSWGIL